MAECIARGGEMLRMCSQTLERLAYGMDGLLGTPLPISNTSMPILYHSLPPADFPAEQVAAAAGKGICHQGPPCRNQPVISRAASPYPTAEAGFIDPTLTQNCGTWECHG